MKKGPNNMESRTLDFDKPFDSINSAIDTYIEDFLKKTNLPVISFSK